MIDVGRTTLGDVAQVDSGPAFQSKNFGGPGEGTPLLRGDNIEPGALRWSRVRTWPDSLLAGFEHLHVAAGDVILAMDRPLISSGLKLARVKSTDVPALLVQRVARVRVHGADSDFVYYMLQTAAFSTHLLSGQVGTQLPHITLKRIKDFALPLPSIREQRRIVEILEDHLSRLEAAAAALYDTALRLRLLEAGCLQSRLGMLTHAFEAVRLGDLAVDSRYGTSTKCVTDGAGPPVVRIPNLVGGRVDLTDEKRVRDAAVDVAGAMLGTGDLLVVRTNGSRDLIGRTAVVQPGVDAAFASYLIRYRLDRTRVSPEWVHLVIQAPSTRMHLESMAASSAGQYNLSLTKLDQVEIPLPPIDEQERQVVITSGLHAQIERLRVQISAFQHRRSGLQRALLSAAFAGRLTTPDSIDRVQELAGV
jgi:type I restriction enzyme S subunit